MEVTEVRIKLMEEPGERLQAFCSITFDNCFVIRDLKIIEGTNGPFVAMPSRKLTSHCARCGCKNHLRAAYCNHCGTQLPDDRAPKDDEGRAKLYADIAHPINSTCREMIQDRVIRAFQDELARSKLPGYVPSYDDFDDFDVPPRPNVQPQPPHRPAPSGPHFDKKSSHQSQPPAAGPHKPPQQRPQNRDAKPGGNTDFGAGVF